MRHAVRHLKKSDPVLSAIIERLGTFRMEYDDPSFEAMARSIVFQQLAGKAAATIFARFSNACAGRRAGNPDTPFQMTPASVLALTDEEMRACGLSRQKISYLRDLAARTQAGEIDFAHIAQMPEEEVVERLTRVKGIGVWSAHMFLMFALRHPDIMPTGDFGIRAAVKKHYRKRKLPTPAQLLKLSQPWRPYRSVACWYLWRSLDAAKE
jgi:3-methyladenine DNA glycosylase/8-oxoguanine DNA glycosylase